MQKYQTNDIKSFEFSNLEGVHVVGRPKFESFSFQGLTGEPFKSSKISEDSIRSERAFAQKNDFKIDGIVKEYRGLSRQEQEDLERRIHEEVKQKLESAYQQAHSEGLEKGREEGRAEAYKIHVEELALKMDELEKIISSVKEQSDRVLEKNQLEICEFVKRFTKWILLKEINEQTYLEGLLEKLVLELNARKNLIVKVGKDNFAQMPDVIKMVEARLGQLSNVRIEIMPEIKHPGIVLESDNGLIDGSIEGVFKNIDKIFDQVVGSE